MRIGIPKEIKPKEGRIALIPSAVSEVIRAGHQVAIQASAGVATGYSDDDYRHVGATIAPDAAALYQQAEMVLKVKEPIEPEYKLLRRDQLLFSYLHLAAEKVLTRALLASGVTGIAFETVEVDGKLPLLAPMSDIAGRLAVHIGTTLLHGYQGGRGVLLGGTASTERGNVVVLGAGTAGGRAAAVAAALGAQVTVFAPRREELERMQALGPNVTALPSYAPLIEQAVVEADLLIGAVLVLGGLAPKLVSAETVRKMKRGSVIVDISVDQGGCIETIRPTNYDAPTYVHDGVIHFAVANMPGAVPRTASQALSTVLTPYVVRLANAGIKGLNDDPVLARAVNVAGGRIVHPRVAEAFNAK